MIFFRGCRSWVGDQVGVDRSWLTEQRYRAVREAADGAPVTEVALRFGVSRQAVYSWKRRYESEGMAGLMEKSRRPHRSPSRLDAEVEALVCELRRAHPRWGARRLSYELGLRAVDPVPSRVTVHRALVRNGLVRPQEQRHKRKYRRWQREAPMQLWQLDLVGGVFLAGGRECKMLTGIDDHSRFVVIATVVAVPSGRAVCEGFLAALRRYGIPSEVLTDNGKQFTGRFTKPRPAEVLFEKTCREHGITARLTKPRSPTTTGKVERFHRTLRRELLDEAGAFPDLAAAQAAIDAWVRSYNHERPHQSLDMATPASRFRPDAALATEPALRPVTSVLPPAAGPATARPPVSGQTATASAAASAAAVEFDTVVAGSGQLSVLPRVQRIRMGQALAGRLVRVWVDQRSVHLLYQGQLVKTVPSNLSADDLHELRHRGAQPAGPQPAPPAPPRLGTLPATAAVEVDRAVDATGFLQLAGHKLKVGTPLAGRRVIARVDGHLVHIIDDGVLAKTLPASLTTEQRAELRGARMVTTPLPAPPPGPISVQRRVARDGLIMVTRQRLRVGSAHAGKTVTVLVEDTYFRILHNGEELCLHPRTNIEPITRFKVYAPRSTDEVSPMS